MRYMYTGSALFSPLLTLPLLVLSHSFNVLSLKEKCGEELYKTSREYGYLYEIADKYKCKRLEALLTSDVVKNFERLNNSGRLLELTPYSWEKILASDDIPLAEEDVFTTMLIYAQTQNFEDPVATIERLLPYIRFGLLSNEFLSSQVAGNSVLRDIPLTHELLHECYRYKILPNSELTRGPRSRPRVGSVKWSTSKRSGKIQLDKTCTTAYFLGTNSTWETVMADRPYRSGVHYVELKINKNNSNWIFIGVTASTFNPKSATYVGSTLDSWAYGSNAAWGKVHQSNSTYGSPYTTGDVVRAKIDMTKGELSFSKNGVSMGVCHSGLPQKKGLYFAVTLYHAGDSVTLRPCSSL